MLSIVNGKIYCTYIAAVPMGGVDSINRLKLNRTQVFFSFSTFVPCILILSEFYLFTN